MSDRMKSSSELRVIAEDVERAGGFEVQEQLVAVSGADRDEGGQRCWQILLRAQLIRVVGEPPAPSSRIGGPRCRRFGVRAGPEDLDSMGVGEFDGEGLAVDVARLEPSEQIGHLLVCPANKTDVRGTGERVEDRRVVRDSGAKCTRAAGRTYGEATSVQQQECGGERCRSTDPGKPGCNAGGATVCFDCGCTGRRCLDADRRSDHLGRRPSRKGRRHSWLRFVSWSDDVGNLRLDWIRGGRRRRFGGQDWGADDRRRWSADRRQREGLARVDQVWVLDDVGIGDDDLVEVLHGFRWRDITVDEFEALLGEIPERVARPNHHVRERHVPGAVAGCDRCVDLGRCWSRR